MSDEPIQGEGPALPDPLRAELSRLYRADANVSPQADQKILNRARAHFARHRRLRLLLLRTVGAAAAVAAVVVLSVFIVRPSPPRLATVSEDVNGDGLVDIRDALALARAIDAGSATAHDVNHDGVTDRRDVDAIALSAVRLDKGTVR